MEIRHTESNSISVVSVKGFINNSNAAAFVQYVSSLLADARAIVIDCQELDYFSSTGIGALIYAHREAESVGRRLVLCHCNNEIQAIISMLSLPIQCFEVLDEAKESAAGVINEAMTLPTATISETSKAAAIPAGSISETVDLPPVHVVQQPVFDHPLVIECPECNAMVKINSSGKFKCPDCGLLFSVDDDRTIYFKD